jgi:hypothetical protein
MAELEAKAKGVTPSSTNGNVQSGSDRSSSSPSDQSLNSNFEELVQNTVNVDFRSLDFNPEVIDLSLFTDFGKVTFQRNHN